MQCPRYLPQRPQGVLLRRLGSLLLAFGAVGLAAQTLPPTPPTSTPSQINPGAPQNSHGSLDTPLRAQVIFAHGELQVRADNSSLNQILRSISHQTGLKITGGVAEQRVFGTYGPAPMSTVLATLLDGTGTNILLLGGDANTPPELILTPRNGAPALPGPDSPTYAMYDDADHQPSVPPPAAVRQPTPVVSSAPPTVTQPEPLRASNPPAAASPAKTLTPEMVMQELLQMQKQQTQQKQEFDRQTQKEQLQQSRKVKPKPQTPPGSPTPQ